MSTDELYKMELPEETVGKVEQQLEFAAIEQKDNPKRVIGWNLKIKQLCQGK
jgi:hypothetical protein